MNKAVPETVFFASWLTAGSAIDRIFDDWRACVIFVFAFIFLIAAMTGYKLRSEDPDLTMAGLGMVRLKQKAEKIRKGRKK